MSEAQLFRGEIADAARDLVAAVANPQGLVLDKPWLERLKLRLKDTSISDLKAKHSFQGLDLQLPSSISSQNAAVRRTLHIDNAWQAAKVLCKGPHSPPT